MSGDEEKARVAQARALAGSPLSPEKLLAILEGEDPAEVDERARVYQLALKIENLPVSEWPSFVVRWDLSADAQRFAFDGMKKAEFAEHFPLGLRLEYVRLAELDAHMQAFNLRTADEVWSVGTPNKAARCIVHWSEGKALTPVCLCPVDAQVGLAGGNHRLAVARAKAEPILPVYIPPDDYAKVASILEFEPRP